MPKPPPRHPRPDPSKTSPQASRQQNALFKGLARQMTGLSALGLPNSPELQRWRATIEEDHRASRPGRKPKGSAAAERRKRKTETEREKTDASDAARRSRRRRKCGVCGGEGHNARTCALAPPRPSASGDLVSYYEAKYGNLPVRRNASLVSVARRDERSATRGVGRPRASLSIAVRCSVCGALGHNRRFHEPKRDFNKRRPGPQRPGTCSWCGEEGHNSRGCPKRRGKTGGYGFAYGYAYGFSYGYRYGLGAGTGGWVPEFQTRGPLAPNANDPVSDAASSTTTTANATMANTSPRFAARSKPLELRAATLWLRSHARSADEETALSVGEACARVGVAARFKQNVWNATKRARAGGWADDGAADEFLDPPTTESVRSAEG